MGNGSAAASDGDRRRVGGVGGKDVRSASARDSLSYRIDVSRVVGTGKQGRRREVNVVGFVGVVNVSLIVVCEIVLPPELKRVPISETIIVGVCGGPYVTVGARGRGSTNNPEGLVGVVLALFQGNKKKRKRQL